MSRGEKSISISLRFAKELVRILDKYESATCNCEPPSRHTSGCPAHNASLCRDALSQRINNPDRYRGPTKDVSVLFD